VRQSREQIMADRFVFHGEYWLYLFAGISVIVGLLYILDGPINIGRWFM
jgi:hypothetical protein